VVHRDIKPHNIFVKGKSCVLGDFGLMKQADTDIEEDRDGLRESFGAGMPLHYRTPDLVEYLEGGAKPTPKSDVFQLGLVLAELFTGRNPQKPCARLTDPVELDRLGKIPGSQSRIIADVIHRMLTPKPQQREPARKFLDPWDGIFRTAVKQAHALEGRAIW
jgi:serine/threonine protein kinase